MGNSVIPYVRPWDLESDRTGSRVHCSLCELGQLQFSHLQNDNGPSRAAHHRPSGDISQLFYSMYFLPFLLADIHGLTSSLNPE